MSWMHNAACRDVNPELFHPLGTAGRRDAAAQAQEDAAKAVCVTCPEWVRAKCLEFALDGVPDGIAGGLNEAERRAIRRAKPIRVQIDAQRTWCQSKRHPMEGDNLGTYRTASGRVIRWCRECERERRRTGVAACSR